jgi:hypothetical protein
MGGGKRSAYEVLVSDEHNLPRDLPAKTYFHKH